MNNFIFIYFLFAKRKKINIFSHYSPRVQRTIVNHSSRPQSDTKLAEVRSGFPVCHRNKRRNFDSQISEEAVPEKHEDYWRGLIRRDWHRPTVEVRGRFKVNCSLRAGSLVRGSQWGGSFDGWRLIFFQFWWLTVIKWKFEPTVTIYAVVFWRSSWPYTSRISKYFQIQAMSSKVLLCLESVFLEIQELIFPVWRFFKTQKSVKISCIREIWNTLKLFNGLHFWPVEGQKITFLTVDGLISGPLTADG